MRSLSPFCIALIVNVATSAAADTDSHSMVCDFSLECIVTEACQETNFDIDVTLVKSGEAPAVAIVHGSFSSDAETWDLTGLHKDGQYAVSGGGLFPASHHLTVGVDGSAIYTNHINSEMSITYTGACQ